MQAYEQVESNAGSAGIDKQSLAEFRENLKDNLYKIWNRLSSGSYMPPAVKAVPIPKKSGGKRILGIPTVADRVAQTTIKLLLEPKLEPIFHQDSYGYRPNRSAIDAVGVTRKRCWKYNWLLEFDIKGAFDNLSHDLQMKAVKHHTEDRMILLYVERWLKAPLETVSGEQIERTKGVPQGSIIGPLLMNLFMHYAFDMWMGRTHRKNPFARYADDAVIHCTTREEAERLKESLQLRLKECGLELHPEKTRIVYCKDGSRKGKYKNKSFDFLGYTFRPRKAKNTKLNCIFVNFSPGVSKAAIKTMCQKTRKSGLRNRTELSLKQIANWWNPILGGWLNYYGAYYKSGMYPVLRHFNKTLVAWAMRKYKRLNGHKTRTSKWLEKISKENPGLFVHWRQGMVGGFA